MKMIFYDAKPYDKVWFDMAAKDEGFEVFYVEDMLDSKTVKYAKGFDAVCVGEETDLGEALTQELKDNGISAIVFRCEDVNRTRIEKKDENGLCILRVPTYSPSKAA
ncbi:MAG: hypothetical protein IJ141_02890 [Lachnospiraceae bacterium]|nr:hypothetical protein [Lachnospiraceae bacterium]